MYKAMSSVIRKRGREERRDRKKEGERERRREGRKKKLLAESTKLGLPFITPLELEGMFRVLPDSSVVDSALCVSYLAPLLESWATSSSSHGA
jgi:hypothetical protein